jgi:hypothetical protein
MDELWWLVREAVAILRLLRISLASFPGAEEVLGFEQPA